MLKIVSNTTPIISLLKIQSLEILKELYTKIIIPTEVFNEIQAGKTKAFYEDLSKINWIEIQKIQDEKALNYFLDLDKGEAEAIILANEIGADLILLDESLGRIYAKHSGLKITGTIGILLKAKSLGIISDLKPLLVDLKEKGIWLSEKFIAEVLKIAGE